MYADASAGALAADGSAITVRPAVFAALTPVPVPGAQVWRGYSHAAGAPSLLKRVCLPELASVRGSTRAPGRAMLWLEAEPSRPAAVLSQPLLPG